MPSTPVAQPFWTVDAPRPTDLPAASLPTHADVAVIGSGYTGLNAALTLAKAGANVVVLEQHSIGFGASSRNGGMLNPGMKESVPVLAKHFGMDRARDLWAWSLAAIDHVEGLVTSEQIDCDFTRAGQVVLAFKPSHLTALRREAAWHHQELGDNLPAVVGPEELHTEIGSPSYFGGLRDVRAAGVHPAKYVFGLAHAAQRAGVRLVEQVAAQRLDKTIKGYAVTTAQGTLLAQEVLLATNGYTTALLPVARRGIFSAGSYIVTTEPLSPSLAAQVSPRGRMFFDTKHFLNYFRLTPDNRMLFGGRHDLSTGLDLQVSARQLHQRMLEVFPSLVDVPLSHTWTGRLGLTFDLMPHAGRLQGGPAPGVFYAYGYGGHGVAIASYLGHAIGCLMGGIAIENPILALSHPRYFFTPYERYYLPLVSAWYRFLDRVS